MSDEINLPDRSENSPLSNGNPDTQLVCDLHVKGDKVYLPQAESVDFKSAEYEKCFLGALPDDIASEVSSILKAKRHPLTTFNLIILLLFLSIGACTFYCLSQKTHFSSTSDKVSQKDMTASKEYRDVISKAQAETTKKHWNVVIDLLREPAKMISENKEKTLENELLLRLYFDAVHFSFNVSSDLKEETMNMVDQVRRHSPNRLGWFLDWLRLNYPEETNYFLHKNFKPNKTRAEEIKKILPEVNPYRWKNAPDYKDGDNAKILDLQWACLNFIYWCYCNPEKNLDKDDSGIAEREEAYRICKKYTRVDDCDDDFLQLKKDIIQRTIDAGVGWGSFKIRYYFDGETHWVASDLKNNLKNPMEEETNK